MGENNLPLLSSGTAFIQLDHINDVRRAFSGVLVGRSVDGTPGAGVASFGTGAFEFLELHVTDPFIGGVDFITAIRQVP